MSMDIAYVGLCVYLCSFVQFYALNVVINLSVWTPNGEFLAYTSHFLL